MERENKCKVLKNRTKQDIVYTKIREAEFVNALDNLAESICKEKESEAIDRAKEKLMHADLGQDYINIVALDKPDGEKNTCTKLVLPTKVSFMVTSQLNPNLEREEMKLVDRERSVENCLSVLNSLFDFAMEVQHLRQHTKNAIPRSLLSDLRKNFVMGLESEFADEQALLQEKVAKVRVSFSNLEGLRFHVST